MVEQAETKKRGGSNTAKEKKLVGIVVHVTPDEHKRLHDAVAPAGFAGRAGGGLKEFVRQAALAAAEKLSRKKG